MMNKQEAQHMLLQAEFISQEYEYRLLLLVFMEMTLNVKTKRFN